MGEVEKSIKVDYAGFWIRFGACIIDVLIIGAVFSVIGGILWAFTVPFWFFSWGMHTDPMVWPYWGTWFPSWIVMAAYFVVFWAWRGETPGMMVLKLRIVHADGTRLKWDFRAALLRILGYLLCWITAGLLFLLIAVDSRKQGIHDKIAETFVVVLPKKKATTVISGE